MEVWAKPRAGLAPSLVETSDQRMRDQKTVRMTKRGAIEVGNLPSWGAAVLRPYMDVLLAAAAGQESTVDEIMAARFFLSEASRSCFGVC